METLRQIIFIIIVFAIVAISVNTIAGWISRGVVYDDARHQREMEYCIGQQRSFEDCWLSVHRPFDYQDPKE